MDRFSIQMPFFPGFYETWFENCDTSYWAIKEELDYLTKDAVYEHPEWKSLTEDDLEFDYQRRRDDIISAFIDVWKFHAPEIVDSVELDCLDSPRYYNFRNDYLYCWVTLNDGWQDKMRDFIALNYDWLKKRVEEDWSSRDGFVSFMCNDLAEWDEYLFTDPDPRYIGTMLGYMMLVENKNMAEDIAMSTLEDIYDGSYVSISKEAEERIKEGIENGTIQTYDPDQMVIPFSE